MENMLTTEQNIQLAEKIAPTIKLIELYKKVAQLSSLVPILSDDTKESESIIKTTKEIDSLFFELLINEKDTLELVICSLLNSADKDDLMIDLKALGISNSWILDLIRSNSNPIMLSYLLGWQI